MTPLTLAEARDKLADAVDAAQRDGERTVLHRHGKPAAAVVSLEDLELLRRVEDAHDLELARQARAEGGPTISHEQLKAELGL